MCTKDPGDTGLVATELAVNVYTPYVRIVAVHGRRIAIVEVDPRTLEPIRAQYRRREAGVLPTEAIVGPRTTISDVGPIVSIRRVTPGRYAKMYGQKRPDGRTVLLRQVELLRKR
ncbi:MAG TPA: hypothetical protein VHT53_06505 [Candidatus Elarobacter sp.]|jgi:hypothetical protein|nr:hypothetical protein [Candidatus Elarobacter sp.]